MSFFSSPASKPITPEPQEDPAVRSARESALQATNADRQSIAEKARKRYEGKTMGTAGANATYTDTAAGFGRTMGSANI